MSSDSVLHRWSWSLTESRDAKRKVLCRAETKMQQERTTEPHSQTRKDHGYLRAVASWVTLTSPGPGPQFLTAL